MFHYSKLFCGLKLRNEHTDIKGIFVTDPIFLMSLRSNKLIIIKLNHYINVVFKMLLPLLKYVL